MCTVSMIADHYREKFVPLVPQEQRDSFAWSVVPPPSRERSF